jgi:hypothetical protein
MATNQIDTPQKANSVDYKKVLEKIQSSELKEKIVEILRNHSREAYIKRLKDCGVILNE